MLVWIALALLTGAAVFAVLLPLSRADPAGDAPDETATDAAFYKNQLAEIERDADRGLIDPADAETARVEAARRLLAATRRERQAGVATQSLRRRKIASLIALVGIPLVSLPLYFKVGQPDLPGQPLASRTDRAKDPATMELDEAMARIEAHLAQNPDDGAGNEVIGPVYMNAGRYEDAARAYAAAIRILGEKPTRLENYGEALVAQSSGIVSADARKAFERALQLDPKTLKARFYRALAAEQEGDTATAVATYRSMAADAPPGSALASTLEQRLSELGAPPVQPAPVPAAPVPASGPGSAAGAAIAALPEGDRMTAIRGMVDALAARLEQNGADVEGWLRLVRSYAVLGEAQKARDAFARGKAALASDTTGRERLDALGRELNLGGS